MLVVQELMFQKPFELLLELIDNCLSNRANNRRDA